MIKRLILYLGIAFAFISLVRLAYISIWNYDYTNYNSIEKFSKLLKVNFDNKKAKVKSYEIVDYSQAYIMLEIHCNDINDILEFHETEKNLFKEDKQFDQRVEISTYFLKNNILQEDINFFVKTSEGFNLKYFTGIQTKSAYSSTIYVTNPDKENLSKIIVFAQFPCKIKFPAVL